MRRSLGHCAVVAALMVAALMLPLALGGGGGGGRALQAVQLALTDANIRAAVAQCLAESADGDCPNSPYGHIRDWVTSAVTDMGYRARATVLLPLCARACMHGSFDAREVSRARCS